MFWHFSKDFGQSAQWGETKVKKQLWRPAGFLLAADLIHSDTQWVKAVVPPSERLWCFRASERALLVIGDTLRSF